MTTETKRYAVSSGNGNDGVSHMWPDYIVTTDDPWKLARLAALTEFKPEFVEWAKENMEVDGEEEFTIQAVIYDPPSEDDESEDDNGSWSDANGAWRLWDIYLVDDGNESKPGIDKDEVNLTGRCPEYGSLEACFGADVVASLGKDD